MRVNNLNVDEPRKTMIEPIKNKEPILLPICLGENDVHALNSARSHYSFSQNEETICKLIEDRHQITELTLSKTGRHMNQGYIQLDPEVTKQIIKESHNLGLAESEYIRGIIYSRSNQLMKERMAKRLAEEERNKANRVIRFELQIKKEIRENLYKKYGELTDKALIEKVREDVLGYLNK